MKYINPSQKKWVKGHGYKKKVFLKYKNTQVQTNIFKPGSEVKSHFHKKTTEIFYILKGRALLWIKKRRFKAKPGDVFLCQAGEKHRVKNNSKIDFLIFVFRLSPSKKDTYYD